MPAVETPVLDQLEAEAPELRLLIPRERWSRVFVQNLGDLFRPRASSPLPLQSAPATFWPDVFVESRLPWRRFLESGGYHVLALTLIFLGSRFLALQPRIATKTAFNHADVVYYTPSEYLPPLDTRRSTPARAQKADPVFARQPIISVPREANNHSQTIVSAPRVQLHNDIPLPNTVAWSDKPRMPIAPAPLVPASEISRLAPRMEHSVIAPPPVFENVAPQKNLRGLQQDVIAPPPALDAPSRLRAGDLNIGHSAVIAPAPQLSVEEQRTVPRRAGTLNGSMSGAPQVIAPPPSVGSGSRSAGTNASMVALSLHPAVGAPPQPAAGNRRGSFAAGPNGHTSASGAPGASGDLAATADGSGRGKSSSKLPFGLYVGKAPGATSTVAGDSKTSPSNSVNPNLIAGMRVPRTSRNQPESDVKLSEPERAVFGGRKVYSLSLNMPNLNSAGGSWIIRFAALKSDATSASASTGEVPAPELSSPVATSKVDPAYPLELMKQNVGGTVILYGVIFADGTVGGVRVLRSVDERLDRFASDAIVKWHFQPATKNGSPVPVEATFWIPFKPSKTISNF